MRIFSSFLLSIFVGFVFLQPLEAEAIAFRDVNQNDKHREAIMALSDQGLVKGYSDGSFRPNETINRAEGLKILVEATFSPLEVTRALDDHRAKNHWYVNVPDVRLTDWFGPYVEIAFKNNIAQGYPDNTFKPTSPINFAEGLKMILAAYDIRVDRTDFTPVKLIYVKRSDWFAPYFAYAQSKNLINADKFYHPAQRMTRGELVEIVYRLQEIRTRGLTAFIPKGPITSDEYRVTIPRLNIINQPVGHANPYDGKGALKLLDRFALGHYLSPPGSGKKMVLYGHSWGYSWYKSPYKATLARIDEIREGDTIYINYQERGYVYQVYKNEIIPEKFDDLIMANQEKNELALYTCWPLNTTKNRYVVYGKPI